ncbi:MAG: EF-hand domain-containing protein [Minicystis sp.]
MATDRNQEELVSKIRGLLLRQTGKTDRDSMQKLFKSYDKDGNGRIGSRELEQLLKDADVGNGFTRGMWVDGIIKKLDSGRMDGEISWEEFDAVMK